MSGLLPEKHLSRLQRAASIISPLLQYFGGLAMMTEYSFNIPGMQLTI